MPLGNDDYNPLLVVGVKNEKAFVLNVLESDVKAWKNDLDRLPSRLQQNVRYERTDVEIVDRALEHVTDKQDTWHIYKSSTYSQLKYRNERLLSKLSELTDDTPIDTGNFEKRLSVVTFTI